MDVYMEVEQVRGGGADLKSIAPGARKASDRVQGPAETAESSNAGFVTGGAGVQWQSKFGTVTEGVERRVEWQGAQVTTSADDMDDCDRQVGVHFRDIERGMPKSKQQ